MFRHDFQVHFKNEKDFQENAGKEILIHLICRRLTHKKPVIFFVTGDSGEGKSYTALKILDIINEYFDLNTLDYMDDQIVYVPVEYATKMNKLLFQKGDHYRRRRVLMIDEGRELLPSKLWYSFINQAIADVNAMSRGIKPIALLIVSQFVKDIDLSVRRTITYYGKCYRPLYEKYVNFTPFVIWKDDRDLENPKLRKRRIRGLVKIENKRPFLYVIRNLKTTKPSKEIIERYEKIMLERKAAIIRRKLEEILKAIEKELSSGMEKVDYLVNYYIERPDLLRLFMERKGKKLTLKKDFEKAHDLTPSERKEFEKRLIEKLAEKGLMYA